MDGKTNIQIVNEQMREAYTNDLNKPLLSQIMSMYNIKLRTFAEMFGVSKSHAEELYNHKKMPSLELAVRLARYCECTVEELFAWRVDDDGMRRPLLVELPGTGSVVKIPIKDKSTTTMGLIKRIVELVIKNRTGSKDEAEKHTKSDQDGNL